MERQYVSTGTKWEASVGYSRAVRVGAMVWVAGTTAVDGAGQVQGNDAYEQASFIFRKIAAALSEVGASLDHVVRTRMFVTRVEDQDLVGRAHFEAVGHARPAATMVQISALVDPQLVVEIEVEAFVA